MSVEELIRQYLPTRNVMQLATVDGDQPWACNLHFCNDDKLNLYWLSTPQRRHSEEIKNSPKVAAVIMVHENTDEEDYVIGISVEGVAELIDPATDDIIDLYQAKHGKSPEFMADIKSGENPHRFYKLTPKLIVLFDNKNFPDNPRQEWKP